MKGSDKRAWVVLLLSVFILKVVSMPLEAFSLFKHKPPPALEQVPPAASLPSQIPAPTAADEQALALLDATGRAFSRVAQKATPAVVNIGTVKVITQSTAGFTAPFGENDPLNDFFGDEVFKRFFQMPQQRNYKQRSLGSGVIVDPKGFILTNYHVIEGADEITVTLLSGKDYKGKVIGADPKTDLAVIKIDTPQDLPTVLLGDSDKLQVGEWAVAIGNPFGLKQTVTAGIISAKGRSDLRIVDYEDFIQTDAAINPGNSGGALLNIRGELIGVNTAIFSRSGGYQGIGFAIPINMARRVMQELIQNGKIVRGWLGISIQDVTPELAKQFNLKVPKGVLVGGFIDPSPAKQAGLQIGDVIVALNDKPVDGLTALRNQIAETAIGKKVRVAVLRNGQRYTCDVKVARMPDDAEINTPTEAPAKTDSISILGLTVTPLTLDIAKQLGLESDERGVVVSDVVEGGPADEAGIQRGDLVQEVNKLKTKDLATYQKATGRIKLGDQALILIKRGQYTQFVVIKAQK